MNNVSEEDLQTIIESSLAVSSATWIPGYSVEDIRQEAIIIGINGMKGYNGSIPLYKYMINHMRHRLRTLRTKVYIKPGCKCGECLKCRNNDKRSKINSPTDISDINPNLLGASVNSELQHIELTEFIDIRMPAEYREDYLKMLAGVSIISSRKNKVRSIVSTILEEYNDC